jgi:septal ring factor EnvC (AmiA/AmiB activator)
MSCPASSDRYVHRARQRPALARKLARGGRSTVARFGGYRVTSACPLWAFRTDRLHSTATVKIIASLVALAATLVVATGCGGESSAQEQWADSVCTDVGTWQDELQQAEDEIRTALQSPGTETLGAIDTAIRQAAEATRELSDELKALEAPDTASGAEAKQQLDALATQLESTATKATQVLDSVSQGGDPVQALEDLAALVPEVQSAAATASATLEAIQASGSDLEEGFEDAGSCDQFRSD